MLLCDGKGEQKSRHRDLEMAPLHNANWPSHLRVITRWVRTCTDHTHIHAEHPARVSWHAKSTSAIPDRHPALQTHTYTHTMGIRCTWTDWHASKTCTIPVIYPTQTHAYQHIPTAVWPGVMPCGLVSPDRHIKIRHTSVLQFQASDGMAR